MTVPEAVPCPVRVLPDAFHPSAQSASDALDDAHPDATADVRLALRHPADEDVGIWVGPVQDVPVLGVPILDVPVRIFPAAAVLCPCLKQRALADEPEPCTRAVALFEARSADGVAPAVPASPPEEQETFWRPELVAAEPEALRPLALQPEPAKRQSLLQSAPAAPERPELGAA